MRKGWEAEDRAADFLVGLGYTIVTRRYRAPQGEIDLLALDGETLVVVEVKERQAGWGTPEEALTLDKQQRLASALRHYMVHVGGEERAVRFDLVAIDGDGVRHVVDAFQPG